MGQPLTGNEVQATYEGLLKTSSNAPLATSSLEPVSDGAGNDSALSLAQEQAQLKGTYINVTNTTDGSGILIDEAQGDKVLYYGNQDFQFATVTGLPDNDTTYTISAQQDAANVDINLNGSDATVDTITLVAGTNITLSQTGDNITIDAAGGGGGGLINGTGTNSLISDPNLTTNDPVAGDNSVAIGNGANASNPNAIAIGPVSNTFTGTLPYVAIVPNGVDMAFRDNSVVIGPSSYPAQSGVAIGNDAQHNGGGHYRSVIVGHTLRAAGDNDVVIGYNSNAYNADSPNKIVIGTNIANYAEESIMIGSQMDNSDSSRVQAIVIGNNIKAAQRAIVIGNDSPYYASANVVQLGNDHIASQSNESVNIGYANTIVGGSGNNIIIGQNNTIDIITGVKPGAAIIGNNITAKASNTLHINGLNIGTVSEYSGQAAAVAAGLLPGQVYRTGEFLKIVL